MANSGERGLALARAIPQPDLILLDVVMPGLDGYALCAALKADDRTRRIPVIFITARQAPEDEERGFRLGAADYILKPFHLPAVQARVRTHLELKRKTDLLERLAMRDGLTNLPNRRAFDEHLDREWRRALRAGTALGLVLMDIDDFKAFNDHYGHQAGDDCLRAVGRVLSQTTRRGSDFVARYGGEEFAALVSQAEPRAVCELAEHIRRGLADEALPHAHSRAAPIVTLSLGAACCSPMRSEDKRNFLELIDGLLYQAKREGRNRSQCSSDLIDCRGQGHQRTDPSRQVSNTR